MCGPWTGRVSPLGTGQRDRQRSVVLGVLHRTTTLAAKLAASLVWPSSADQYHWLYPC